MKSKTRLDSAVFQLTPTRTRYDLVIIANGKTEKIGSGLLNPFLAHLKAAQDQIAEGGYSITLEPDRGSDAVWFTKGTVERFVRFVSTPEVLERVNTIESEILQIEESIAIQNNDNLGLSTVDVIQRKVEDYPSVSVESIEGSKPIIGNEAEKAIVLYKHGAHQPESNGSTVPEESSKVQLLKVLETRKTALQKEQGMAFARAVAAGFEMDHIADLIFFGECFGATRLIDACLRFIHLWKVKHETGQWVDMESPEAMSNRSDYSSMSASGTMVPVEANKPNDLKDVWPKSTAELGTVSNGKATNNASADRRPPLDAQAPANNQEYFQGQFQHGMFPQWPIHSPPGAPPVFQGYSMQGMPYYPNYPSGPYFQSPYPPMEDLRSRSPHIVGVKSHSSDSKGSNTESETELGVSSARSSTIPKWERDGSQGREQRRKAGRSDKKSGMVVIRNINYITSKKKNRSGSESETNSDPETDDEDEDEDPQYDSQEAKNKNSARSSKNEGNHSKSANISCAKDDAVNGHGAEGGEWQAFQNFLLRDDTENTRNIDQGLYSMEREAQTRQKNPIGSDPIVPHGQDLGEGHQRRMIEFETISGKGTRLLKASTDEFLITGGGFGKESREDVHVAEIGGGRGYKRVTNDDFMVYSRENQLALVGSQSDPLAGKMYEHTSYMGINSSHKVTDESFIVPLRSSSQDQIGTDSRIAIDMELPSELHKADSSSNRVKSQLSYEPDDLSLMPERAIERESIGYDLSVEYEMQRQCEDVGTVQNTNQDVSTVTEGSKKLIKDKKLKNVQDSSGKRKIEATSKKGKPPKFSPSSDAQARAEKLRAFKADLQKIKKEKEEEAAKRLEALKRERQKRIAARGNSGPAQTQSQTRAHLPMKLSPSAHRGSKFSDSEPGSSSPLQRLPVRSASMRPNSSEKNIKISRRNNGGQLAGNGLSRSVSSLPELKKEKDEFTPDPKVTMARIRRLSEPKKINSNQMFTVKSRSTNLVSKEKVSDGPEIKKISAIMSLDRTKAATLPELKIKASKGPSDIVQKRTTAKDLTQKANGSKSSITAGTTKAEGSNGGTSYDSNGGDNPVIEKTVVMLESEKPSPPVIQVSEEIMEKRQGSYVEDNAEGKTELLTEYAKICAPVSPHPMGEVGRKPSECRLNEQSSSHEVIGDRGREELANSSSINITETQYQAPYARVSSLEDSSLANLDYSNGPPTSTKVNMDTAKVYISDSRHTSSLEENPESSEKPRTKESSKGFRRLLKFGKKNLGSPDSERVVESDKVANDHVASSASVEVHTLKNLISQDETPTAGTSQKASRPFSLLSPFRSKTSEKKLAT